MKKNVYKFNEFLNESNRTEESHIENVTVYDNGGESFDRYTVIIGNKIFSMSHNPSSPTGVNLYVGHLSEISYDNLGDKLDRIPDEIEDAIQDRIEGSKISGYQDSPDNGLDSLEWDGVTIPEIKRSVKNRNIDNLKRFIDMGYNNMSFKLGDSTLVWNLPEMVDTLSFKDTLENRKTLIEQIEATPIEEIKVFK